MIQSREASNAIVAIADDGPGIPVGRWEEMLDRGTRLDSSGAGTGLGLAIVKEIAEAWGAELAFQNTKQGFEIQLLLPMEVGRHAISGTRAG
jgi:signal transduction histidine kinase